MNDMKFSYPSFWILNILIQLFQIYIFYFCSWLPVFGLNSFIFTSTGQQQQLMNQQAAVLENPLSIMTSALTMPTLFGDERDAIIAKLNQLQALWGQGKAYYAPNAQPIPFSPESPFSRFKVRSLSILTALLYTITSNTRQTDRQTDRIFTSFLLLIWAMWSRNNC